MLASRHSYEEYCENHTKTHLWLTIVLSITTAIGCYYILSLGSMIESGSKITIKKEMFGFAITCVGFPFILLMEAIFRANKKPSKRLVTICIITTFIILTIGYEFSPKIYRPYLKENGYVLCKEYSTGGQSSKPREVWEFEQCSKISLYPRMGLATLHQKHTNTTGGKTAPLTECLIKI